MSGDKMAVERELAGVEVLLVDADPAVQQGLEQLLEPSGLPVTTASEAAHALDLIAAKVFGVVVIDLDTPSPGAGVDLVRQVRERSPTSLVFLLVSRKSFDGAVAGLRAGVHDVILKAPDQVDYLRARIVDAAGDWVTRRGMSGVLTEVRESYEEFVKHLMESERRASDAEDKASGRDDRPQNDDEVRILFVDSDDRLYRAISRTAGYHFAFAHSGGEALDEATKTSYHIVLVGPSLPDLPSSMVLRTLKSQSPEAIVISYQPNGRLDIFDGSRSIVLVEPFTAASQLAEQLADLAQAHRLKARERRHIQIFRERHYELLRRLAELRKKIDRAVEDSSDSFSFTR